MKAQSQMPRSRHDRPRRAEEKHRTEVDLEVPGAWSMGCRQALADSLTLPFPFFWVKGLVYSLTEPTAHEIEIER